MSIGADSGSGSGSSEGGGFGCGMLVRGYDACAANGAVPIV
ncbi:hypothetical protein [Paenibacillus odorifer]|nr:hypothetical protein [Paenibacillus odorifer]